MIPFPRDSLPSSEPTPDIRSHYESVVMETLRVVWRRWWLVAGFFVAGIAGAFGVLQLLEWRYSAEALIQVDVGRRDHTLTGERASNLILDAAAVVESEARIIRSRAVARRVVNRLDLAADPAFAPQPSRFALPSWAEIVAWFNSTSTFLGQQPTDASEAAAPVDAAAAIDVIALSLLKRLSVENDNRSYLISVGFTSGSPASSAAIANAFADEYLQSRIEASLAAAASTSEWLSGQLLEARAQLRNTEQALQAQRERSGIADAGADASSVLQQQLREATAQLSQAGAARQAEEARLRRAQEVIGTGARPFATDLAGFPSLQRLMDAEAQALRDLAELSSRYGDKHPQITRARAGLEELRTRLAEQTRAAVAGFQTQVSAARATERTLEQRVADLEQARIASKRGEAALRDLQISADRIRDRVKALSDSYEQAVALKGLKPLNAQIVVRAEPTPWPSAPKPALILGLSALGALVAGVVLAMLLERRDRGFRTTAEVKATTGARCLGMLPELPARETRRMGEVPAATGAVTAMFREAIGAIGAAVGPGPSIKEKVVLITSSVPGEGKSVLISALAHALVARGLRVLMIDGQPKRVGSGGSAQAITYPLQTVYEGNDAGRSFFGHRAGEALCVLDRAAAPRNAPNGFNCQAFEAMLYEARIRYDVILIEGPPVMLLADSLVLGRKADLVIHVARWNSTPRKTVLTALQRLADMSVQVAGVVISRVNMKEHRKYSFLDEVYFYRRYHRFYRYSYK